jgi:hypothetical protein
MKAMFKVTLREHGNDNPFAIETTIAKSVVEAIGKVEQDAKTYGGDVKLYVSDVELIGIETIDS